MATIGTTTFVEDGNQNYLLLNSGEQYLRKLNFNMNQCTEVIIGVLYTAESDGSYTGSIWVGMIPSSQGNVGIKDGMTNASMKRSVACYTGDLAGTINLVPSKYQYSNDSSTSGSIVSGGTFYNIAISGSARQLADGVTTDRPQPTTEAPNRKGILIFGVSKASATTYAIRYGSTTTTTYTGSTNHNFTNNTLFSAMEWPSSATTLWVDNAIVTRLNSSIETHTAADEIDYPFDTVNVYWTGSVPVRIYQIAVSVIR